MVYIGIVNDNYLEHHGVKGMKWGVRRYQNPDGSLTRLGKARQERNDARSSFRKNSSSKSAANRYLDATDNYKDAKTRYKLDKQKKKSKRQLKLEQEYIKKGYSKEEAELKAYRRAKAEKIAIGAAIGVGTAAAAYGGYKLYKDRADRNIKAGKEFTRVAKNDDTNLHDVFYAANKKGDIQKYKGLYGKQILGQNPNADVFVKKIGVKENVKIASPKHAADTLFSVLKTDKSARQDLEKVLTDWQDTGAFLGPKQNKVLEKGLRDLRSGKNTRNVYNAYNFAMNGMSNGPGHEAHDRLRKTFTKALRSKGYDAIHDINDMKYSGYNAKNPVIFLTNAKTAVNKVSKLDRGDVAKIGTKEAGKILVRDIAKQTAKQQAAYGGAGVAAVGAMVAANKVSINKKVSDYKREHPGTKMSTGELERKARRGEL